MAEKVGLHFRLPCPRVLALQAILLVKPAHKLQSPLLRCDLVIDPLPVERFDPTEVSDLLAGKTGQFELPDPHHLGGMLRHAVGTLSEFHTLPLLNSESWTVLRIAARPYQTQLVVSDCLRNISVSPYKRTCITVREYYFRNQRYIHHRLQLPR